METAEIANLVMGLLGGLAIFLFGMEQMTDALKTVAGGGMSVVLRKLTRDRFRAAATGALVTAVIQSSSVTTVLVVGFISAGLMTLQQSIGVIMGANVGTTITAQIIAFKITEYALAIVAVGFAAMFLSKRQTWRLYGAMAMGLGMIFLGMGFMSEATEPLRSYEPFIQMMQKMSNPVLGILVAALFTAIVQSSSATTGIVIVLASQGFITLDAGIALVFGANIGSCATAVLASIGKPREAAQAAAAHLAFNVIGVLVWLPLIGLLADGAVSISPAHPELEGSQRLAAETPRQIANAHTIFNVINTVLFIGFTGPLARLIERLLPHRPEPVAPLAQPRYLDEVMLDTPALALDCVHREAVRLGEQVGDLAQAARPAVTSGSAEDLDKVVADFRDSQKLYDHVNEYLRRLSAHDRTAAQTHRLTAMIAVTGQIQNAAETVAVNFVAIGRDRVRHNISFSDETVRRLGDMGTRVAEAYDTAIRAIEEPALARAVIDMKPAVRKHAAETLDYLHNRLVAEGPDRPLVYRLESQYVEFLERLYYFSRKIAKAIILADEMAGQDAVLERELDAAAKPT